jgi:hypothetical protein
MDGSGELTIDGITYNTWNAANGTNGIKPLAKALTIQGADKASCGFDGHYQSRLFKIDRRAENPELGRGALVFKNLTFTRGNAEMSDDAGGAIYLRNMDNTRFENCVFTDNFGSNSPTSTSIRGGALFVSLEATGEATFSDCDFTFNEAGNGGVFYVASGTVRITGCRFEDNGNPYLENAKGGVFYFFSNEGNPIVAHVEKSVFKNNATAQYGGVSFYREGGDATPKANQLRFSDCLFAGNGARQGNGEGGVFYLDNVNEYATVDLSVVNSTIYNNDAALGGGIFLAEHAFEGSSATFLNVTATANRCDGVDALNAGNSGGLRFKSDALGLQKNIRNTILEGNYTLTATEEILPSDVTGQGAAHFIPEYNASLSHSLIGYIACDEFDPDVAEACILGYGAEKVAGLAEDAAGFIDRYGAIPLQTAAMAKTAGNARFLLEAGISTDQLGQPRALENGTCFAGAVEADEATIGAGSGLFPIENFSPISLYISSGRLFVAGMGAAPFTVSIFTPSGQCVGPALVGDTPNGVAVGHLAAGIYIVTIKGKNQAPASQKLFLLK